MVENTVGRIYLDNEPYSELKDKMKYLVEPAEPTPDDTKFLFDDIHALTCADLSCGSGHILNECFDLLYQCYLESGYSRRKAIEDIFRYNLTGVDLDTRAKQLAQFALLVKACQKENSFLDAKVMPRVYDMPRPYGEYFASEDELRAAIASFIMGENYDVIDELVDAITLMNDAENLGSIMIFNISERTRNIIVARLAEYEQANFLTDDIRNLIPYMKIILTLTEKYAAIVMNPPYMGGGNMPESLGKYVQTNYAIGKGDLCTVFMQLQTLHTAKNGMYANIVPPSWMFLGSYEGLRKEIINNNVISSLLHLSRGVFGADFGSVASVIQNRCDINATGTYFRLIERTFQEFDQKHLQILFEKTLENKDFRYYFASYTKEVHDILYSEYGAKIYYPNIAQSQFEKIPGSPMAYWLSKKWFQLADSGTTLETDYSFKKGMSTGDNSRFIKDWFEVSNNNILFGCKSENESIVSEKKWYPINSGGTYRKWYGNQESVSNWKNNGAEMKANATILNKGGHWSRYIVSVDKFFKPGLSWNAISSGDICVRKFGDGFLFGSASMCGFGENIEYVIALLNSAVGKDILKVLAPTMNYGPMQIKKIPLKISSTESVKTYVNRNVSISKSDWDAHETSWDFANNELLAVDTDTYIDNIKYQTEKHFKETGEQICIDPAAPQLNSLEWRMEQYKLKWERLFMQLHANEEELNHQFIDIYGLQDELTPDVPLSDITILQQGEINVSGDGISFNEDVIIKQFISYAVGCMMGRYRLDRQGLAIAHPDAKAEEYAPYQYNGGSFEIDDDGIVPLMSANCAFTDNANLRFKHWLALALGQDSLVENLNFVEKCLGKPIDEYFMKDFWKDHKKMYQNRPIYWMFASKKGAFQCIAYMHRMNAYTAERIRTNYLLPHIEWLVQKQQELQSNAANLSTAERRELDTVTKQIAECREYHDRLHVIADKQIAFDLDDGVLVNYAKFGDVVTKLK
jgi:hypothetical protein